jgi:hypothetical protein
MIDQYRIDFIGGDIQSARWRRTAKKLIHKRIGKRAYPSSGIEAALLLLATFETSTP